MSKNPAQIERIKAALNSAVDEISVPAGASHYSGKVRENLILEDGRRVMVVSDRISAFDFILGTIPFKGQVLNQMAAWWFSQLPGSIPHHLISTPDPQISIVKNATPLPVELVVRGYLTGTTATSAWYAYQHHNREICGITMPEGMAKNEPFASPIITPTTKPAPGSGEHDVPLSREEILNRGLVDEKTYGLAEKYALEMFVIGQKKAAERGFILVDTKYEMGLDDAENLMVIDEIHTPDSSRYWVAETYQERLKAGQEPDMLDKEFVRRGLVANGIDIHADPKTYDGSPFLTDDLRIAAAEKYIQVYEKMTGEMFEMPAEKSASERVAKALASL